MDTKTKFKLKLLTIFIGLILAIGVSLFIMVSFLVKNLVIDNLDKELDSYIKVSYTYLDQFYPGDWKVDGDKIYKGTRVLNDDTMFVDKMEENTGTVSAIYMGEKVVSTNLKDGSTRITSTKAEESVSQSVLREGNQYSGITTLNDSKYISRYVPIKDTGKNTIGMLFVGVNYDDVQAELNKINLIIASIMLFVIAVAIVAINIFTNNVVKNEIIIFRNNMK